MHEHSTVDKFNALNIIYKNRPKSHIKGYILSILRSHYYTSKVKVIPFHLKVKCICKKDNVIFQLRHDINKIIYFAER